MNEHIAARNAERLGQWRSRWIAQGGSFHWQARPYLDLRSYDDLQRGRTIEFKVRATGLSKRRRAKVVNLSSWILRRLRNGRQKAGRALG